MSRIKLKRDRLLYSIDRVSLIKATRNQLVEIIGLEPTIAAERKRADLMRTALEDNTARMFRTVGALSGPSSVDD